MLNHEELVVAEELAIASWLLILLLLLLTNAASARCVELCWRM